MAPCISFPFRLAKSGTIATVEQGTDGWIDQALQHILATVIGERPMAWPFGIPDPRWSTLTQADVQAAVEEYGPDGVTINDVTSTNPSEYSGALVVTWAGPTTDEDREDGAL